jgi:hypothetical protein
LIGLGASANDTTTSPVFMTARAQSIGVTPLKSLKINSFLFFSADRLSIDPRIGLQGVGQRVLCGDVLYGSV